MGKKVILSDEEGKKESKTRINRVGHFRRREGKGGGKAGGGNKGFSPPTTRDHTRPVFGENDVERTGTMDTRPHRCTELKKEGDLSLFIFLVFKEDIKKNATSSLSCSCLIPLGQTTFPAVQQDSPARGSSSTVGTNPSLLHAFHSHTHWHSTTTPLPVSLHSLPFTPLPLICLTVLLHYVTRPLSLLFLLLLLSPLSLPLPLSSTAPTIPLSSFTSPFLFTSVSSQISLGRKGTDR